MNVGTTSSVTSSVYVLCNSAIETAALAQRLQVIVTPADGIEIKMLDFSKLQVELKPDAAVVVVDLPRWATNHADALAQVRSAGYQGPIVMAVSNLSLWAGRLRTWPTLKGVGFIERPFETTELIGTVKRIIASKSPRFRVFPRYEVELTASMSFQERALPLDCTIRNVSHGGACIEFTGGAPVEVGQFAMLTFTLDDHTSKRDVRCRVAWVESSRGLMGAEFVQGIEL